MSVTVAQIKADVKLRFNGISDTDFLSFLREGHAKICKRVQLYPQESAYITWTAEDVTNGRKEWEKPPKVKRGWQARYWSSSTASFPLTPTNTHKLDAQNPDWRVDTASTPSEWYESGGNIGLYPKPSTSPSSGYPKVEIYNTGFEELDEESELPESVDSPSPWSNYIKFRYAESRDPESAISFIKLHRMALKDLADDIAAINPSDDREVHAYVIPVVNI